MGKLKVWNELRNEVITYETSEIAATYILIRGLMRAVLLI